MASINGCLLLSVILSLLELLSLLMFLFLSHLIHFEVSRTANMIVLFLFFNLFSNTGFVLLFPSFMFVFTRVLLSTLFILRKILIIEVYL